MSTPATCQPFMDKIKALRTKIKQIQTAPGYIQGKDAPHPGKPDPESLAEVKKLQQEIAALNSSFKSCILSNVAPFPLKIKVGSIYCAKQQGTFFFESDAPYVLVASIDLSVVPLPNLEVTLYGPWDGVDTGESRNSDGTLFWAINGSAKTILQPTDVIFLVAVMEKDEGSPNATRGLVKAQLTATLAASIGLSRSNLVTKLINDMNSALSIPTGFPNPDDKIAVKELTLSALDLVLPTVAPLAKTLSFSGDGAKYDVTCVLTQG